MANNTPNDPMAKPVLVFGLALIGAAVFVLVSNLVSTIEKNSIKGAEDNSLFEAAASENIQPVGTVNAVDKTIVKAARSGEQVYQAVCTSCHATGTLSAPITGDKAQWEPRSGNGLAGLLKNATNGLNAMPAKGGDPTLTEEELTNAILYMVKDTGLDLGVEAKAEEAPAAAEEAPKAEATEAKKTEEPKAAVVAEPTEEATPAKVEEAPKAEATPAATEEAPKAEEATPAKVEEAPKAEEAPAATEEAPKAEETAPAKVEEAPKAEAAPAATEEAPKAAAPSVNGEKIYKSVCFACHDVGVAGSPKLGNKTEWEARIALGKEALYATSLNGKGVMPPKGGNPALSDDEVKAAVDFMIDQVK